MKESELQKRLDAIDAKLDAIMAMATLIHDLELNTIHPHLIRSQHRLRSENAAMRKLNNEKYIGLMNAMASVLGEEVNPEEKGMNGVKE